MQTAHDAREQRVGHEGSWSQERAAFGQECSRHVLVVERDEHVGDLLADALALEGYCVTLARECLTALSILETRHCAPDVVLLDVDGLFWRRRDESAVLWYRKRLGGEVPVITMTTDSRRARTTPLGAQAMVEKPFDLNALLDVVASHAQAHALTRTGSDMPVAS